MGSNQTKHKSLKNDQVVEGLKHKVMLLQGEVNEIMCMREAEIQAYEREMMVFELKEAEGKTQRRELREEVKKLRKRLEDREERSKGMEDELKADRNGEGGPFLEPSYLLEHIRDDAVEKWKQLYFAIKIELDDLIQRTNQGGLCWKAEAENILEELHRELLAKERTIELQQEQITSLKQEESKWEREVDILRQSLRIMCHKKGKKQR